MPKKDRTDKYDTKVPTPKWYEGSTGVKLAALLSFGSAVGLATGGAYIYKEIQADAADPYRSLEPQEAIQKSLKVKTAAKEKLWESQADVTAALRNYKTVYDEQQRLTEEVFAINSGSSNPVYEPVVNILNTLYKGENFQPPFNDLSNVLGVPLKKHGGGGGLFESLFGVSLSSGDGDVPQSTKYKRPDEKYTEQIKIKHQRIEERLIPVLKDLLDAKDLQVDSNGPKLMLFLNMDKRVHEVIDKISALEIKVENDRNRKVSPANSDELSQHDSFLETLHFVKEQLNDTRHKLTPNAGQNITLIEGRMADAIKTLEKHEERLRGDIAWFEGEKKDPHALETDIAKMQPLRELVEEQLRLVTLIRVEVERAQHLVDDRAPEAGLIVVARAQEKSIRDYVTALRGFDGDSKLTELDELGLTKGLKTFEAESDIFKETVKNTFPTYDREGNYKVYKYDRAAHRAKPARELPDFKDTSVREHVANSLEKYANELKSWSDTWEKSADGRAKLKQEKAELQSPEHMRTLVLSLVDVIKVNLVLEKELAKKADGFDDILIESYNASQHYEIAVKRSFPDLEEFNRKAFEAQQRRARGQTGEEAPDESEQVHGFTYHKPPPQQPAPATTSNFGGVSGRRYNNQSGVYVRPPAFNYEYTGPTGDTRQMLENIWPEGKDLQHAPVRDKVFHALRNTHETDPRKLAVRVHILKEAFTDEGKGRGQMLQEIGMSDPNYCAGAASHWYGKPLVTGREDGANIVSVGGLENVMRKAGGFVSANAGKLPEPGDMLFWSKHASVVVEVEKQENGTWKVRSMNGNNMHGQVRQGSGRIWPTLSDFRWNGHPGEFRGFGKADALAEYRFPELRQPLITVSPKAEPEKTVQEDAAPQQQEGSAKPDQKEDAKPSKPERKEEQRSAPAPHHEVLPQFIKDKGGPADKSPKIY